MTNGAQALIRTLVDSGVTACFTNPGTSEMHFVAALDAVPEMRGVLALFEGVATGAADGYARITDKPAATLLHLGPGLGNGVANLHNARKAKTPIVNVVGDHATYHKQYDAQLESDIEAIARIAYLAEFAMTQLEGLQHLVLVDAKAPVSFFAYPEKPSYLVPDGCEVHVLADPSEDAIAGLEALAEAVGASGEGVRASASRP